MSFSAGFDTCGPSNRTGGIIGVIAYEQEALDLDALCMKLREVPPQSPGTPPYNEATDTETLCLMESQARKQLKKKGCPPCYPSDFGFPIQNAPKDYRSILEYWQSRSGTGSLVLKAQLSDWEKFRKHQKNIRRYYKKNPPLEAYETKIRERRKLHHVKGNVCIRSKPGQQDDMETWIEFQDYHFQRNHAYKTQIEKDLKALQATLEDSRQEYKQTGSTSEDTYNIIRTFRQALEFSERELRLHKALLWWIEKMRTVMDAERQKRRNKRLPSMGGVAKNRSCKSKLIRLLSTAKLVDNNNLLHEYDQERSIAQSQHQTFPDSVYTTRFGRESRKPVRW